MAAKDLELSSDLVPIGQFRSRTAKILQEVEAEGRTLVITQNGKAAAVVMSPREYDQLKRRERLVEEIARGVGDAAADRVQTTAQVRRALKKRRGRTK